MPNDDVFPFERKLVQLLCRRCTAAEVRSFVVERAGDDGAAQLPTGNPTMEDLVFTAIRVLLSRGLPGAEGHQDLVQYLLRRRPDFAEELEVARPGRRIRPIMEPGRFVGRERELGRVLQALEAEGTRMVTLHGPLGIGKTALARMAAHRFLSQHPSWVGAEVVYGEVRGLDALLRRTARALDVDMSRSRDADDGVEQIADALACLGPVLLVLEGMEAVLDLLLPCVDRWLGAAPELRVLGTTRRVSALLEGQWIGVGPMSEPDAVQMVHTLMFQRFTDLTFPAEPEVKALVQRLERIPGAIKVVVAHLRNLNLQQVVLHQEEILRQHFEPLLEAAWEQLDEPLRQAAMLASCFTDLFTPEIAERANRLGASREGPIARLETPALAMAALHDAGWLLRVPVHDLREPVFRMSEPHRTFIRELPELEDARASYQDACREALLWKLSSTAAQIREVGWQRALPLLEVFSGCLVGLATTAPPGSKVALRAAIVLDAYFYLRGPLFEHKQLLLAVLDGPGDAPPELRADVLSLRASVFRKLNDIGAATRDVLEALDLVGPADSPRRARILRDYAGVIRLSGHGLERALEILDEAAAMIPPDSDSLGERAFIEAERGLALSALGDLQAAAVALRGALATFEARGDRIGMAATRRNLADVLTVSGRCEEVPELLSEAIGHWHEVGAHFNEAECLVSRGSLHLHEGRPALALGDLELAERIFSEQANPQRRRGAGLLRCLALYEVSGRQREAITGLERLCGEADLAADHVQAASARVNLALLCILEGERSTARELLRQAAAREEIRKRQNLPAWRQAFQALSWLPEEPDRAEEELALAARLGRSGDPGLEHLLEAVRCGIDVIRYRQRQEDGEGALTQALGRLEQLRAGPAAPAARFQDLRLITGMLGRWLDGSQGGQV